MGAAIRRFSNFLRGGTNNVRCTDTMGISLCMGSQVTPYSAVPRITHLLIQPLRFQLPREDLATKPLRMWLRVGRYPWPHMLGRDCGLFAAVPGEGPLLRRKIYPALDRRLYDIICPWAVTVVIWNEVSGAKSNTSCASSFEYRSRWNLQSNIDRWVWHYIYLTLLQLK